MFTRIFGTFLLVFGATLGALGMAHAYGGWNPSAPELDPTVLGSGVSILAGGWILLNERRRNRK
ncbi:MAG TPA: hypothetical protein VMU41_13630 [Candidatus Binataceae bacterium]|nr:hypothetical protein [Candidatus Binataceae bacterium]